MSNFGEILRRSVSYENKKVYLEILNGSVKLERFEPDTGEVTLLPVRKHSSLDLGFEKFNPLQSHLIQKNVVSEDCNLVIAWKTSTGKTVVAELVAEDVLSKGKKVVYVCPLKALAEEKRGRFSKLFPKAHVEIFTGDYHDFENRKEKAEKCDIAFCSTELLDSLTRNRELIQCLLNNCGLIVLDEAHIIGVSGRGHVAEAALMRATRFNPNIRLLLLSATVKNSDQFGVWVHRLNDKDTYVFESSWRPVKITSFPIHVDALGKHSRFPERLKAICEDIVRKFRGRNREFKPGGVLIFVMTYYDGNEVLKALQNAGIRAEFHNASLSLEDRKVLEEKFNKGELEALVSTTTLAWGCNLSARTVVIVGDNRAGVPVDVWDIDQMAGRAGRTGMYEDGYFYWYYQDEELARMVARGEHVVTSTLREALDFQILGEMRSGPMSEKEIVERFKRSFFCVIHGKEAVEAAVKWKLDFLVRRGFIAFIPGKEKEYLLKPLGVLSATYYVEPELLSQIDRFARVLREFFDDPQDFLRPAVFFMLASVKAMYDGALPTKNERNRLGDLINRLKNELGTNIREDISLFYGRLSPLVISSLAGKRGNVGSSYAKDVFLFCYVNFCYAYYYRLKVWKQLLCGDSLTGENSSKTAFRLFIEAVKNRTYFKFRNQFADMHRFARVLSLLWKEVYEEEVPFELTSFAVSWGLPYSFIEKVLELSEEERRDILSEAGLPKFSFKEFEKISSYCSSFPDMFKDTGLDFSWYIQVPEEGHEQEQETERNSYVQTTLF